MLAWLPSEVTEANVKAVVECSSSSCALLRVKACELLRGLGPHAAAAHLGTFVRCLIDSDAQVCKEARIGLQRLSPSAESPREAVSETVIWMSQHAPWRWMDCERKLHRRLKAGVSTCPLNRHAIAPKFRHCVFQGFCKEEVASREEFLASHSEEETVRSRRHATTRKPDEKALRSEFTQLAKRLEKVQRVMQIRRRNSVRQESRDHKSSLNGLLAPRRAWGFF